MKARHSRATVTGKQLVTNEIETETERYILLSLNTTCATQLEHIVAHRHARGSELRLDAYSH